MSGFDAYGIVLRELYATRDRLNATIELLEYEKNNPTLILHTPNTPMPRPVCGDDPDRPQTT